MNELQKQQLGAVVAHVASQDIPYRARTELVAYGTEESLSDLVAIYKEGLEEEYPDYEVFVDLLDSPEITYEDDTTHDRELLVRVFNMIKDEEV